MLLFANLATWWSSQPVELQAAVFAALTTWATAAVGFYAVTWQVGRQAGAAIAANKAAEAQKLKLRIYDLVVDIVDKGVEAEVAESSRLRSILPHLDHTYRPAHPTAPKSRFLELVELRLANERAAIRVISLVERWQIIDPRIKVFQTAINTVLHDAREGWQKLTPNLMLYLPTDASDGQILWFPPPPPDAEETTTRIHALLDTNLTLNCYYIDLVTELQNVLLGDLFGNHIQPRRPIDPASVVIRLDDHAEIDKRLNSESAWGQFKDQLEATLRKDFAGQT